MTYGANKYAFVFQQFETIRPFCDNIFHVKIKIVQADTKRSNLLNIILKFNSRDGTKIKSQKKRDTCLNALYKHKKIDFDAFKSEKFSLKLTQGKEIKLSTPEQMLQIFSISLALLKVT